MDIIPPEQLYPGDILITNDPWMSAGHFFDITLLTPVFRNEKLIGYCGSTIHHTDIGGYGVGAGARDIHEEGLWIPVLKLYERGEANATLHAIIRQNVRTPDSIFGDLAAQVSSGKMGGERLNAMCDRYQLDDINELSRKIVSRAEQATREDIRKLPAGTYHGETQFDVPGGDVIVLKTALTIDSDVGEISIDFAGSSGPSPHGINANFDNERRANVEFATDEAAPKATRPVYLEGRSIEVPVFDRNTLASGQKFNGPVIIEERETTVFILPGWSMHVHSDGSLIATRN